VSLVKPTLKSGPRVFIQNLFCNFLTFLQVSMNFRSLHYFLRIKSIEERFKTATQCRAHWQRGHRAQPVHGDALIIGPVVASRWQGVAGELVGTTGRTLGKVGVGRAHRGGGATMGRRGSSVRWRAAGSSPKGESAATTTSSWSCGGG
jgi:hypothetical protein